MTVLQILGITGIISLVLSCFGFWMYVYFFSVGYGFSIAGIGIFFLVKFWPSLSVVEVAYASLLTIYGLRLGLYIARRGMKNMHYKNLLKKETKKNVPFFVKFSIWISVCLLYVCQAAPLSIRIVKDCPDDVLLYVGLGISALGIIIEYVADMQKTIAKKTAPDKFVKTGLYRIVRCPNYLGELLLWTGTFLSGLLVCSTVLEWSAVILGYVGIVYVMFSGARRLELRQDRVYGEDPEYQEYSKKTPIILPLIPIYSVKKHKWLVA